MLGDRGLEEEKKFACLAREIDAEQTIL